MPPSFDMRSFRALSMSVLSTAMPLFSKLVTLPHQGIGGKVELRPSFPSGPHQTAAGPDPAGHHKQSSHAHSFGGRDSELHPPDGQTAARSLQRQSILCSPSAMSRTN